MRQVCSNKSSERRLSRRLKRAVKLLRGGSAQDRQIDVGGGAGAWGAGGRQLTDALPDNAEHSRGDGDATHRAQVVDNQNGEGCSRLKPLRL